MTVTFEKITYRSANLLSESIYWQVLRELADCIEVDETLMVVLTYVLFGLRLSVVDDPRLMFLFHLFFIIP